MEGLGRFIDRTLDYLRHDIYRSRSVVSKESVNTELFDEKSIFIGYAY